MKRKISAAFFLCILLLLVTSVQAQRGGGVGWVRFGHASSDAEEVSIQANGDDWIEDMEYGIIYVYFAFEEGDLDIEFDIGNRDFEDNIDFSFEVEEGKSYSVFVVGSVDEGTLASALIRESDYVEDEDNWDDFSHLIVLNAMDDGGFDVFSNDDDEVWFELPELNSVGYIFLAGQFDLDITEPGDENEVLIEDITGEIEFPEGEGTRYLFVISGSPRNPDFNWYISGYRTIGQILRDEFPLLADAAEAIDFDGALDTQGNYTLFAPTDDTLENYLDNQNMDVDEFLDDNDAVIELISYHLLLTYGSINSLSDAGSAETALDGEELEFDLSRDDNLEVNGVEVARVLPAVNGIIYEIDEVLEP